MTLITSQSSTWTPELLRRMDWKRFQELAAMLLSRAGFRAEIAWVRPDGASVFSVAGQGLRREMQALVQCAGWNEFRVEGNHVAEFYRACRREGAPRGIYITPGEFDPNAQLFVRGKQMDLIDGQGFLAAISRMTPEEQAYYHRLATVGAWDVPSCPACGIKMALREVAPTQSQQEQPQDLVFRTRELVNNDLDCHSITVKADADVLFMKSVITNQLTVEGRVMGNIVCRDRLCIAPGGMVSGFVSARSIKLEPGGILEAEAKILNAAELEPVKSAPLKEIWTCPKQPRCRHTLALREESSQPPSLPATTAVLGRV
jgi:hypothetical protein